MKILKGMFIFYLVMVLGQGIVFACVGIADDIGSYLIR